MFILCFRSVVGDVQTRLKSSSVGAGSGEDHSSQQTQKYLVTIQNDIRTLLSKSKVQTVNVYMLLSHAVNCVRFCFWCCLWLSCLCVKYLGNRWMDFCQIHREDVFGPYQRPATINFLQYLITGSIRMVTGPFQLPAPQSGTLSQFYLGHDHQCRLFQTLA